MSDIFGKSLGAANASLPAEMVAKLKEPVTREELLGVLAILTTPFSGSVEFKANKIGEDLFYRWTGMSKF